MMFTCSDTSGGAEPEATNRRGIDTITVDIHCHFHVTAADALITDKEPLSREPIVRFSTEETNAINQHLLKREMGRLTRPEQRIAYMDKAGIDVQALSPNPFQYYYWTEPEIGRATARCVNDHIAEVAAAKPDRFVALGTVPLQNTEFAIAELERLTGELGMRGIEINTNVNGGELSDERLRPFWARVEELGVFVFLHPLGFTEGQRLANHYLNNLVGQPLESTLAISHLIFGGVLENYPGLKICVAHGGGFLPVFAGRMDHAYGARADCRHGVTKKPSEYLKQLYFDTIVFTDEHLSHLVSLYGADRLLLGTDFPYDMAEADPVGFVSRNKTLSQGEKEAVCGCTAARLLRIDPNLRRR